jgi:hypothetical protein
MFSSFTHARFFISSVGQKMFLLFGSSLTHLIGLDMIVPRLRVCIKGLAHLKKAFGEERKQELWSKIRIAVYFALST